MTGPAIKRALIVLAHPEVRSFNHQLANVAVEALTARGYTTEVSDLYADGFDPVEGPHHYQTRDDPVWFRPQAEQRAAFEKGTVPGQVRRELDRIAKADLLILQFPMWWYQPPAMLKGWLDRCFTYGETYTSDRRYDRGRFRGRRAVLSVTTGGREDTFQHNGRNGDIELLLWPMCFSLYYVGYDVLRPLVCYNIDASVRYPSTASEFRARLDRCKRDWAKRLWRLEEEQPMPFNGWDDWDDAGRLLPGRPGYSHFMRSER